MTKKFSHLPTLLIVIAILSLLIIGGNTFLFRRPSSSSPLLTNKERSADLAKTIAKGNDEACDQYADVVVDGVNYRTVCKNNVVRNKALTTLDYRACKGLDDRLVPIRSCEHEVVRKKIMDGASLEYCKQIGDRNLGSFCEETYWQSAAVRRSDIVLCENLEGQSRAICEQNVFLSLVKANPKTVDCNIAIDSLQGDCEKLKRAVVAPRSNRPCETIDDPELRQVCAEY